MSKIRRSPTGSPIEVGKLGKLDFVSATLGQILTDGTPYNYASVTTEVGEGSVWALVTLAASFVIDENTFGAASFPLQGIFNAPAPGLVVVSVMAMYDSGVFSAELDMGGEIFPWRFDLPIPEGGELYVLENNRGALAVVSTEP